MKKINKKKSGLTRQTKLTHQTRDQIKKFIKKQLKKQFSVSFNF
jgi:Spy/CpxP family protein refolding chaperone